MLRITNNIVINPQIQGGRPVIKGTRVPVDLVVHLFEAGDTIETIMYEYDLTQEQIKDALEYHKHRVHQGRLPYVS